MFSSVSKYVNVSCLVVFGVWFGGFYFEVVFLLFWVFLWFFTLPNFSCVMSQKVSRLLWPSFVFRVNFILWFFWENHISSLELPEAVNTSDCLVALYCVFSLQVMGSLADKKPEQGQRISGILVKRNFNYHILSPCDLSSKYRQWCDQ